MDFSKSLDTLCASLCEAMQFAPPATAAAPNAAVVDFARNAFAGRPADRLFMYNPDAVAAWVEAKYPDFMREVRDVAPLEVPMTTVMPSVTPVCFATMYTGTQPAVHGIRKYEKPVLRTDSLWDAALRAGKKCAIVAEEGSSMSRIYNEREMDYFFINGVPEVNAKAAELILEDRYDIIAVYNGNYDETMHRWGPEHALSLAELRTNVHAFATFADLIRRHWTHHDTLLGFAMDHGCHEIDGGCGSHGLDMDEDLHIVHHYAAMPRA